MTMSVDSLTESIVSLYKLEAAAAFPQMTKSVTVGQIPKEDGSFEYSVTAVKGPAEVDEDKFRPLAKAIAQAVIEHLKSSAEAVDGGFGTGRWRIE